MKTLIILFFACFCFHSEAKTKEILSIQYGKLINNDHDTISYINIITTEAVEKIRFISYWGDVEKNESDIQNMYQSTDSISLSFSTFLDLGTIHSQHMSGIVGKIQINGWTIPFTSDEEVIEQIPLLDLRK